MNVASWIVVAIGLVYIGCRQVALWWRVQDLERAVRELIKEVDGDND